MTLKKALSTRSILLGIGAVFFSSVIALGFILIPPFGALPPQQFTNLLPVFSTPSQLPAGEHWILIGSTEDLPDDILPEALAAGVTVLEVQKISKKALGVKVQVPVGAIGKILKVSSVLNNSQSEPETHAGGLVPQLVAEANFKQTDMNDGHLVVNGPEFIYGYLNTSQSPLAALRIHNRQTGKWHTHEKAIEKARLAAEPKEVLGPAFKIVDPLETLPDTDGDQIYDFAEEPEVRDPVPEQLGVELVLGTNLLDIVAVDEAGNASWKTIAVYTAHSGF